MSVTRKWAIKQGTFFFFFVMRAIFKKCHWSVNGNE